MSSTATKRQQQILDYVRRHRTQHGVPPTVREIQNHFGFASPNAAASHLRALERKKLLRHEPGAARTLRVTPAGDALPMTLDASPPAPVRPQPAGPGPWTLPIGPRPLFLPVKS